MLLAGVGPASGSLHQEGVSVCSPGPGWPRGRPVPGSPDWAQGETSARVTWLTGAPGVELSPPRAGPARFCGWSLYSKRLRSQFVDGKNLFYRFRNPELL